MGKTTTAVHLAHGLALAGQRVVLLDLDPQGNATLAMHGMPELAETVPEQGSPFAPMRRLLEGLWVLPSPGARRNLARNVRLDTEGLARLATGLEQQGVNWLLVDCPPRMDQWGWAGLQLCREVLVPVQAEFFAMHGLSQMMRTLEEARAEFPGRGQLLGVLVTMLNTREPITLDVLEDLRANLGLSLLETTIYRDAQIVEAASHGKTLFEYNLFSKGARSDGELVREVIYGRTPPR